MPDEFKQTLERIEMLLIRQAHVLRETKAITDCLILILDKAKMTITDKPA